MPQPTQSNDKDIVNVDAQNKSGSTSAMTNNDLDIVQAQQFVYEPILVDLPLPPRFNGRDFQQWRRRMRNVLIGRDLFNIVTGVETAPGGPDRILYDRRVEVAAILISEAVDETTNVYLDSANGDPKEMWDLMEKRYAPTNAPALMFNIQAFFTAKLEDGEALHDYFARLRQLSQRLPQGMVNDLVMAWRTIEGLPDSYESAAAPLRSSSNLKAIQDALLLHEQYLSLKEHSHKLFLTQATGKRRENRGSHSSHEQHKTQNRLTNPHRLTTQPPHQSRKDQDRRPHSKNGRPTGTGNHKSCQYCRFLGHTIRECNKLKRNLEAGQVNTAQSTDLLNMVYAVRAHHVPYERLL